MFCLKDMHKLDRNRLLSCKLGNQQGVVAQFLVLLVLVAGLAAGIYLVQTGNLKLFSRASNPPIVFKSLDGKVLPLSNGISQSTTPSVIIELTSTLGAPVSVSGPISGPDKTGTVAYRTALNPTDLDHAIFTPYLREPTSYNSTFPNVAGTQFLWVDFKAADGKVDRRSAQIQILATTPSPSPTLTSVPTGLTIWPVQYRFGPPAPGYKTTPPFMDSWYQVQFRNNGLTNAYNVKAFIATVPPSAQILDGEVTLGNISKGQSVWSSDTYRLKINTSIAGKCDSVTWRVEYDYPQGVHHILNNIPQFAPGKEPGGCNSPTPIPTSAPSSKRVFVTSTAYNGNLGGLTGADAKCQARANAANLGGTWKAWLSDGTTSVASRLNHATVPYKTVNGTVIANNWVDLTDGTLQNTIGVSELGVPAGGYVWTYSNPDGTSLSRENSYNCHNWTTAGNAFDNDLGIVGNTGSTSNGWSKTTLNPPCTGNYQTNSPSIHLYCFEQ